MKKNNDIISVDDFDRNCVEAVISLADLSLPYSGIEARPDGREDKYQELRRQFDGSILCTAFFGEGNASASTRTRRSFESAMKRLGGDVISFTEKGSSLEKGENKERTLKNLQSYSDLFVIRDQEAGSVANYAALLDKPVINAGDGSNEHPTQFLTDAYTVWKITKRLDDITIAFVGDLKGRVIRSNIKGFRKFDRVKMMGLHIPDHGLPEDLRGHVLYDEPIENLNEALNSFHPDIIYWTRVQTNLGSTGSYKINPEDADKLPGNALWMHPQPIVGELPGSLDQDRRAIWYKQAAYGVPVRMALISRALDCYKKVKEILKPY